MPLQTDAKRRPGIIVDENGREISVKPDATVLLPPHNLGTLVAGEDDNGAGPPIQRNIRVNSTGHIVVVVGGGTTVLDHVEEVFVAMNADIFGADVLVPRDGDVIVEFITDTALGVLSMKVIRNATTRTGSLNNASAITLNAWQGFDFPVRAGDLLNLRSSVAATVTAMLSFQDTA